MADQVIWDADKRLEFHEILVEILGSRHVYFQPPETIKMEYPAIVYSRSKMRTKRANGNMYNARARYSVQLIDPDPDSPYIQKLLELPLCSYDRHYVADNLNHDVFDIYY